VTLLFLEGFDKYGPANSNAASTSALINQEWTASNSVAIVAGLSATGFALQANANVAGANKTLSANYARLIGGVRFSSNLVGAVGMQFCDGSTAAPQASVTINAAGTIAVRNGAFGTGTILGTSTATVTANSTHYLEWDITFSNAGSYQLWLDGVSVLSGSGDTTATANNYANVFQLTCASTAVITWDDLYLFDTTGTTNNAVLLTSPRIETSFPTSDGAVQFAVGAATLGSSIQRAGSAQLGISAALWLRPLTPTRSCTINSISLIPAFNNANAHYQTCIYTDSAGVPGALMGSSSVITGATNGTTITGALTTPQSLTAGTQYWLGIITDIASSNYQGADNLNASRYVVNTFASGPPSTAPAMTSGVATLLCWGSIILASPVNWYEVASQPPQGAASYVYDSVVGHEDLYAVPNLSVPATTVYAVAVKANVAKSDAGAKTVSVRLKSGATDSAGSGGSLAPGTSYAWLTSLYPTDPATSAAWTLTAVNAAQIGLRVES
jgi:hypothetical protein